ncbi:RNA polymerase sigma-70 factor, ECF subfamily [Chitinophaga costaii]|uniref:RNA polymerase sigma-70 factor, ECF subfamily n=1 Tax=Chitinophaga costaii TaxID=1335309 RepID=A0A1C4FKW9_9BACT|nr:RNA polymerase sigma-70 factor [Chitinophaga costaii]PUZ29978.1 RNA polymerase sigma-70 factor [Chitinophaga costaii]SCC56610.1 RNA polymerase sigma-70 factor, ECF subfamily [Chitinophaga costaii]
MNDEQAIGQRLSAGDTAAFKALYDIYFDRLAAFVFKLCKLESVTEDIVQEVFLKVWLRREGLAQVLNLESYIFSMAHNRVMDYLRTLNRETRLREHIARQETLSDKPEAPLHLKELQHLINIALAELSPQKQQVFRLSKQQGLSHDEIAAEMGLAKSTVKNHLSETLRHLYRFMGPHTGPEVLLLLFVLRHPH